MYPFGLIARNRSTADTAGRADVVEVKRFVADLVVRFQEDDLAASME